MSPAAPPIEPALAKALSHPLRMRILTILGQRVASPVELATELDVPLNNLSYHVRTLLDLGCIELVRTEPRRGTLEHFYRAIERPIISADEWSAIPLNVRRAIADGVLTQIAKDLKTAAARGGFDRSDVHLTRTPLAIDEQGWDELAELTGDLLEKALEIQAAAAGRIADRKKAGEDEADTFTATLSMLLFEQPPPKPRTRRSKANSR
jgi:DNA-binding transcriptional ArsR family regulator